MRLIPKKISLVEAYNHIDSMFLKWFSKIGITVEDVFDYYPNVITFDNDELLVGMLWIYYNYPIDWIATRLPNIPNRRQFRQVTLVRIVCFLRESGSEDAHIRRILHKLLEVNYKIAYSKQENKDYAIDNENELLKVKLTDLYEYFLTTLDSSHPLKSNAKQITTILKQRVESPHMFSVTRDNEMTKLLLPKLAIAQEALEEKEAAKQEAIEIKYEHELKKNTELQRKQQNTAQLLQQEFGVVEDLPGHTLRIKGSKTRAPIPLKRHVLGKIVESAHSGSEKQEINDFNTYDGVFGYEEL